MHSKIYSDFTDVEFREVSQDRIKETKNLIKNNIVDDKKWYAWKYSDFQAYEWMHDAITHTRFGSISIVPAPFCILVRFNGKIHACQFEYVLEKHCRFTVTEGDKLI